MFETILRRVIIAGAFLVLLVPFVVTDSAFFPFIVGKGVLFRILVGVMLGAWAALAISAPAYRPRWSPVMISAAVFLGVVGIADMLGVNVARSFWSNFERMEGFVTIFHVVAYLLVLGSVFRSERLWEWFWNASIVASFVMSLMAFADINRAFEGQLIRIDATLGNPTYLAVYLLINIFIALFMAYRGRSSKLRVSAYGIAIVAQIAALYYTGTRGAFLGLVAGIGIAALAMLICGRKHPTMRRIAGAIIGLTLVGGGAFFALRDTAFVQDNPTLERIANISLVDTTVQSRLTLWTSIGWNAFLERPLLGWGQDNFIVAFGKYYDPIMYKQEPWFDRAHNVFVDWAIAGGVVGLISYLALFIAALVILWRSSLSVPEKAILTGLLGAYAVNNIFVFDNLVSYIYFASVLAYVHARGSYGFDEASSGQQAAPISGFLVGGVAVIAVALIWFTALRPMARAQTLLDAIRMDRTTQDVAHMTQRYQKALAYGFVTGLEETREQLSMSALRTLENERAAPEARAAIMGLASSELADSAIAEPNHTRRLYFLAHFLKESDQHEEALEVFDQVLAINPTRQNFIYEVAQIHLAVQDFEKAAETFKTAYDVEPENDTAFVYYAASLMLSGKVAEGDALLEERFGTTIVDNELLIKAYERLGRSERLAGIIELRLSTKAPSDDPGLRISLALVYLDLGRRDDAIAQIERAAVIKPEFAAQAAEMIKAIREGRRIEVR